jgi:ATP-dependent RNA helicase HelY
VVSAGVVRAAAAPQRRSSPSRADLAAALSRLKPGDVIDVGGPSGRAAVVSVANRKGDGVGSVRIRAVTGRRKLLTLGADDFDEPPVALANVELPVPYTPHQTKFQHAVAARVNQVRVPRRRPADDLTDTSAVDDAHRAVVAHPVHGCGDRRAHLMAMGRVARLRREVDDLTRSVKGRTESLARRFDRVLRLLEAWGHLDGWSLTDRGRTLSRLYHECDLVVAECVHEGLFDDLEPAALAGLASVFGYEHRSPNPPPAPWYPSSNVKKRYQRIDAICRELHADEEAAGLPLTRPPDPTFIAIAYAWAAGEDLGEVLEDEDVTAGDFVRVVKQVVDLLRQIGDVAPRRETAAAARAAADALHRGVVAASSAVTTGEDEDLPVDPDAGLPL